MPGGGIPSLGPCMTPVPGRAIPGAVGDPSWLSVPISEGVPVSPLESLVESSGGFTLPAGANFKRSNSVEKKEDPPGAMDVGDSRMGRGRAGGLPMGAAC